MEKSFVKVAQKFAGLVCASMSIALSLMLSSCGEDSGLGATVDTESPVLSITYPPTSAIVKGEFVFAGSASDDKGIAYVKVTVKDSDSNTIYTTNATPDSDGIWSVLLNDYNDADKDFYNGWRFADGTYEITAMAYDNAGRTSGLASKTISIDNTAPVLVLTKPTSVGSGTAKTYGQAVQLQGSFSEASDGNKINLSVHFYDSEGKSLFTSQFDGIVDMSSANPLTIAQYYPVSERPSDASNANYEKWQNYLKLYGEDGITAYDNNQTPSSKSFYFTVTASDNAKTYADRTDEGVSGGNSTSVYYRGTIDMLNLIEGKTIENFGVLALRNYLNKTDLTYSDNETLEAILSAAISESATTDDSISASISNNDTSKGPVYLNFQINPLNNPKYAVSGYAIDSSKTADNYSDGFRKYYTGSSELSVTVSPGLDETNIDTSTVSIYVRDADSESEDDNILVWTWNEATAIKYAQKNYSLSESDATARIQELTSDSDVYRYTPTSSGENTDGLSVSVTLDDGLVSDKNYKFIVTGYDIDEKSIVSTSTEGYGLWASTVAEPPSISFDAADPANYTNLSDDSVVNASVFDRELGLLFNGTIESYVQLKDGEESSYTIEVSDTSGAVSTLKIEDETVLEQQEAVSPYVYDWTIIVSNSALKTADKEALASMLSTEGRYKMKLTVSAKSSGGSASESRTVIIDTKTPVVRGLSISDSVSSTVTINSESYSVSYITGKKDAYDISGSSSDNYELESTGYKITGITSEGSKTLSGSLGSTESWTIPVDLTDFITNSEEDFDVIATVWATDSAGNVSSESNLYIILDSVAPEITSFKVNDNEPQSSSDYYYKDTALPVSGSLKEDGSGIAAIYYQLIESSSNDEQMTTENYSEAKTGVIYTESSDSKTFSTTVRGFEVSNIANKLIYIAVDNVGNVSEPKVYNIRVDNEAPTITAEAASTVTFNGKSALDDIIFTVEDTASGIDTSKIVFNIGSNEIKSGETTYGTITATKVNSEDDLKYTIKLAISEEQAAALVDSDSNNENALVSGSTYSISATLYDYASNYATKVARSIEVDTLAPTVRITAPVNKENYVKSTRDISLSINDVGTVKNANWAIYKYNSDTNAYNTETNQLATGELSFSADTSVSPSLTIDISSLISDDKLSDGEKFVVCIQATDNANNTSAWSDAVSSVYTVDVSAPSFDSSAEKIAGKSYDSSSTNWYDNTGLSVSGSVSDSGSGILAIYYQVIKAGVNATEMTTSNYSDSSVYTGIIYTSETQTSGTETYEASVKGFVVNANANKLIYVIVDNAGNATKIGPREIYVDNVAPVISAPAGVEFGSTVTANGKNALSDFTFYVYDAASDVDKTSISVSIGGNLISNASDGDNSTYGTISVGEKTDDKYLVTLSINSTQAASLVASDNALASGSSYSVNATVYDNGGNSSTQSVRTLKVDTLAPTVEITKVDTTSTDRFVKNTKSITVRISDTGSISSVKYAIFASSDASFATPLKTVTENDDSTLAISDSSAAAVTKTFSIDVSDITSLSNGSTFVVCVSATDGAGNEGEWEDGVSSIYTVDQEKPTLSGDNIGGSTYIENSSNWFNNTTLSVSGTWTDSGSGVKTLYYQLNGTTALTDSNYVTSGTSVAVTENEYDTNIKGFVSGTNYLRYVAVDYAGNVSDVQTRTVYVDQTAPSVTELESGETGYKAFTATTAMGKLTDIELYFRVSDANSGLGITSSESSYEIGDAVKAIINEKTISSSETTYGSLLVTELNDSVYTVKLTLKASALADGVLSNGASYGVTVILTDVAGNEKQQQVATLAIDTSAPTVNLTQDSGSSLYAKEAKTVAATLSDSNGISSYKYALFSADSETITLNSELSGTAVKEFDSVSASDTVISVTASLSGTSLTADGSKFVIGVKATDSLGNESPYYASSTYIVDVTPPVFGSSVTGAVAKQFGLNSSSLSAYDDDESTHPWFSSDSIAITGSYTETGSGISRVYYEVAQTQTMTVSNYMNFNSFSTTASGSYESFSQVLSGLSAGTNYITLIATDNVGNVQSNAETYIVYVDKTDPTFDENGNYDSSELTNAGENSTTTFTFDIEDSSSGISTADDSVSITVGTLSSKKVTNVSTTDPSAYGTVTVAKSSTSGVYTVSVNLNTGVILDGQTSSTYAINATITDNAGNTATRTVRYLSVDKQGPTLTITSPSNDDTVNKIITVTGSATDANDIASITLTAVSTSDETGITKNYAYNGSDNTISLISGTWKTALDTTSLYNSTESDTLTLTVAATDKAGNTSTVTRTATIDQKSDRPEIVIDNLDLISYTDSSSTAHSYYVLKNGKNAQISGTISDDDGITTLIISDTALTAGATAGSGTTTFNAATGKWTYTPSTTTDGEKTVYFYVKDSGIDSTGAVSGNEFYTDASSNLVQPLVQNVSTETASESAAALTYKSDSTNPAISDATLTYNSTASDSDTMTSQGISTSLYVGGTERQYIKFVITATDNNNIAGMTFTVGNTSSNIELKKYATSASILGTSYSDEYTSSGSADTTASNTMVWTTAWLSKTDLGIDSYTGSLNLTVTAYDYCGLSGTSNYQFMVDNTAPIVNVTSPSASSEQLGTDVTVAGSASDTGKGSVSSVYWGIPKNSTTPGVADDEWTSAVGSGKTEQNWGFTLSSVASYLQRTSNGTLTDNLPQTYYVGTVTGEGTVTVGTPKSGKVSLGSDTWEIPIWFKVTDELGNETIDKSNYITYNPNGDMPVTTVKYPTEDYYDSTLGYVNVGGKIKLTGTTAVSDSGKTVSNVYIQIGTPKTTTSGTTTTVDWTDIDWSNSEDNKAYTAATSTDSLTATAASSLPDVSVYASTGAYSTSSDWWGFAVNGTAAQTYSWTFVLNSNEGLNSKYVAVRVCGLSSTNKMGAWDGPYYMYVDQDTPRFETKLKRFKSYSADSQTLGNTLAETLYEATADSEKEYSADMYVSNTKNDWYLEIKASDTQGIDTSTIKINSSSFDNWYAPDASDNDTKVCYIYVPLSTVAVTDSASVSYQISVYDIVEETGSTAHEGKETYSINIDNASPAISALASSSESSSAIAYTKLKNSNYGVTFGTVATDTASGFSRMAYYFKRDESDGSQSIELPVPSVETTATPSSTAASTSSAGTKLVMTVSSGKVEGSSTGTEVSLSGDSEDDSGLYGVWLSNGTRSSADAFSQDNVSYYAEKGLIRTGGLVRIGGTYYLIKSVSGDVVTFTEEVSTSFTDAFFVMAFIIDNTAGESAGTPVSGEFTLSNDDGDGVLDTVKKEGSAWYLDTKFYADELDDGPIYLSYAAFDNAENVASDSVKVMIANNTPRLTKVFLATDLNGDGAYAESEFVYSSVYVTGSSHSEYLEALSPTNESATAIVTTGSAGDWKDSSGNTTLPSALFRISDSSVVTFEYVAGYQGYGSGNNSLTAYMSVGSSALTSPDSTSAHSIGDVETLEDTTITWSSASKAGIEIASSKLYSSSAAVTTYGSYTESTSSADTDQYLSLTLWDNTTGTTVGVPDSNLGTENAVFGSQYTVLNIPVYFDFVDDQAPAVTIDSIEAASASTGHVEQGLMPYTASGSVASKLPSANFTTSGNGQNTLLDQDPKVSGTVVFSGTVSDNKRINAITLKMLNDTNASYIYQLKTAQTVASYSGGALSAETAASSYGWTFAIVSESFSQDDGHKINWTLTLPSDYVMKDSGRLRADIDMPLVVSASDYNNSHTTSKTQYVDVVPYIRSIARSSSGTVAVGLADYGYINRSKLGHYPVSQGETLTITGFNLYDSTLTVGSINLDATTYSVSTDYTKEQTTFVVPAWSGALKVTVNGVQSLNNLNGNPTVSGNVATAGDYDNNLESFKVRGNSAVYYASDDRYIETWNLGNYFKNTNGGAELQEPVMTADKLGNLYASWVAQSNSNVIFSYGVAKNTRPIFRFYDQPATTTSVAFDTKGNSGGVAVGFIPEHQGSGGTFSTNAMSSSAIDGGMGAISIPSDYITNQTVATSSMVVTVEGNPLMYSDDTKNEPKNRSSWYNLANYAMNRRLASFEAPASARFGNYLHTIWYDNVTEGLKYSVVDVSDKSKYEYNSGAITGWIVLDGGYTGQDRVHEWDTTQNAEHKNNTIREKGWNQHTVIDVGEHNARYTDNIFYESVSSSSTTSVTVSGTAYQSKFAEGDTIALLGNTAGDYQIALRTITGVNGMTISWDEAYSGDIDSVTIYGGKMNVLGGTVTSDMRGFTAASNQSSSAGSSSSIDVDAEGRPVVAYLSADDSTLRIARFNTTATVDDAYMKLAANWTRTVVSGTSCSGEVSLRVDGSNNIHIMYKNADGQLCYLFGTPSGNTYKFNAPEIIDENGSLAYGTLSVRELTSGVYVPVMSYLNSAGTAQAVKYAYRTRAPSYKASSTASNSVSDDWDYMILPSLGNGHYAVSENKISLEAHKSTWTATDTTVLSNGGSNATATPATVQAAVAFKSKQFETSYLLTEK